MKYVQKSILNDHISSKNGPKMLNFSVVLVCCEFKNFFKKFGKNFDFGHIFGRKRAIFANVHIVFFARDFK